MAEATALASFYDSLKAKLPGVPIVLAGDFNADLSSLELELLKQTDLIDFHDQLGTPVNDRISLFHFDSADKAHAQVLDYILISPNLKNKIVGPKSYTYRYMSFHNIPYGTPQSLKERYQLPSDHYPVVLTLSL
jgi:endonuclease/exonuclease/phosphatase family metal-dependent hydrolase